MPPHWLYTTAQQRAAGVAQGRNEPGELPRIAQVLAELRHVSIEQLQAQNLANLQSVLPRCVLS
jgi:TatD DNase family protein